MLTIFHHAHAHIKGVDVAKQMYLLIHSMNSVLAYFHSRLHSDLFFGLHIYFTRFQIALKIHNCFEKFSENDFSKRS